MAGWPASRLQMSRLGESRRSSVSILKLRPSRATVLSPAVYMREARQSATSLRRTNPNIRILASIDPASFPLGTGPKKHEIWHNGFYPVVWTNRKYKMIYFNFGHNDIDYEHKYDTTNKTLSYTLNNPIQDRLIIDALLWLGDSDKARH